MKLDWRKAEFFGNVSILDLQSFINLQDNSRVIRPSIAKKTASSFSSVLRCQLTDFPFTHSVARELEAMADPQPNVLNLASTILPFSSTWI